MKSIWGNIVLDVQAVHFVHELSEEYAFHTVNDILKVNKLPKAKIGWGELYQ